MVQVSYPGVYVVEVPSGVHTITGVATSIAAFFGRTSRGPINRAVRLLSYADYERSFGGTFASSDVAQSVRQFFDNGGSDCYVVRLAHGATTADLTLQNLANLNVLTVTSKMDGAAGNGVRLQIDYDTANPDETFNIVAWYEESGTVVTRETYANLSMDAASPRYAPDFVTQSSSLVTVALHADVTPAVLNACPAGYSQSRAPIPKAIGSLRAAFQDLTKTRIDLSVNGNDWVTVDFGAPATQAAIVGAANVVAIGTVLTTAVNDALGAVVPGLQVTCTFDDVGTTSKVLRITSNSDHEDKRARAPVR